MADKCKFDSKDLPKNFTYRFLYNPRIYREKTLTADVIQSRPYYKGDTEIEFSCDYFCLCSSRTLADTFLTAFKNCSKTTFIDYDSTSYSVVLIEYNEKEEKGWVSISGKMVVRP